MQRSLVYNGGFRTPGVGESDEQSSRTDVTVGSPCTWIGSSKIEIPVGVCFEVSSVYSFAKLVVEVHFIPILLMQTHSESEKSMSDTHHCQTSPHTHLHTSPSHLSAHPSTHITTLHVHCISLVSLAGPYFLCTCIQGKWCGL